MQEQKPEDDNIDAEYEATNEHIAAEVQSVVIKFGAGSPPADQDPAVIICFVTIPGGYFQQHLSQAVYFGSELCTHDIISCTTLLQTPWGWQQAARMNTLGSTWLLGCKRSSSHVSKAILLADRKLSICVPPTGIGKSALLSELGTLTANNSSSDNSSSNSSVSRFTNTTVAVLNGDTLRTKQGITGMRYWHQVC